MRGLYIARSLSAKNADTSCTKQSLTFPVSRTGHIESSFTQSDKNVIHAQEKQNELYNKLGLSGTFILRRLNTHAPSIKATIDWHQLDREKETPFSQSR